MDGGLLVVLYALVVSWEWSILAFSDDYAPD